MRRGGIEGGVAGVHFGELLGEEGVEFGGELGHFGGEVFGLFDVVAFSVFVEAEEFELRLDSNADARNKGMKAESVKDDICAGARMGRQAQVVCLSGFAMCDDSDS